MKSDYFRYFNLEEFECNCGCGLNIIDEKLVLMLDSARYIAGEPFYINSGCRCESLNIACKGSKSSQHLFGKAVDIKASNNHTRMNILRGLLRAGFKNIIVYETFIHVDIRNNEIGLIIK